MKNMRRKLPAGDIAYIILILVIDCLYGRKWFSGRFKYAGVIFALNLLCLAGLVWGPRFREWLSGTGVRIQMSGTSVRGRMTGANIRRSVIGIIWWFVVPPAVLLVVQVLAGKDFRLQGTDLLLNLLVYYLLELVLSAVVGQIAAAQITFIVILTSFGLTCSYLNQFRNKPLTIFDMYSLGTAANVADAYDFSLNAKTTILLLGMVLLMVLTGIIQGLRFGRIVRAERKKDLLRRILVRGGIALAGILALVMFINIFLEKSYLTAGDFWNLKATYRDKGAITTLIAEFSYLKEEKPEGYSADLVREAVQEFAEIESAGGLAEAAESETVPEAGTGTDGSGESDGAAPVRRAQLTTPVNLIAIMNESLADYESLYPLKVNEEVLPFIHSMKENTIKGNLYMPVWGGGTADSEYEFLTGNTRSFLPQEIIAYMAYTHDPEYGLPRMLQAQGYRTIAMHPNTSSAWNRKTAYSNLGFDEFIDKKNWGQKREKIRGFTTDASVYDRLESLYDEKNPGSRLFTFCVTIQNHGGYDIDDPDFEQEIRLNYDQSYPRAEQYLSLAHESDKAFKGLIKHFSKVDEPTMIVMFGDHQPAIEEEFLNRLSGTAYSQDTPEGFAGRYLTPYIIWTNYNISETGLSEEMSAGPDMSANYFGKVLLQAAGADMSPYFHFLDKLQSEISVVATGGQVRGLDGTWFDRSQIPQEYQDDWKLYQDFVYNEVFDRGNLVDEAFQTS